MARAAALDCFAPAALGAQHLPVGSGLAAPRQAVHPLCNPWQLAIHVPSDSSDSCCTTGAAAMSPRSGDAATPGSAGGPRSARRVLAACSTTGSYADVSCWLDAQVSMRCARSAAAGWASETTDANAASSCSWQLAACGGDEARGTLAPASPGAASLCLGSGGGEASAARCGGSVLPPPAFQLLGLL